jgi:hypothetical protein
MVGGQRRFTPIREAHLNFYAFLKFTSKKVMVFFSAAFLAPPPPLPPPVMPTVARFPAGSCKNPAASLKKIVILCVVERLYCKRPILCLASSKLLTPHPLHRPASVYPPPSWRGEDTLAGWRGGWGVNILEDARHSSVLYICTYFVLCVILQNNVAQIHWNWKADFLT